MRRQALNEALYMYLQFTCTHARVTSYSCSGSRRCEWFFVFLSPNNNLRHAFIFFTDRARCKIIVDGPVAFCALLPQGCYHKPGRLQCAHVTVALTLTLPLLLKNKTCRSKGTSTPTFCWMASPTRWKVAR